MAQDIMAVANKFIELSGGHGVTHMKLQKLIYLAHEEYVRRTSQPLVNANPEVWQYGPVFGWLYHMLKEHQKAPITQPISIFPNTPAPTLTDPNVISIVQDVWNKYGGLSAVQLSDLTHRIGTPWRTLAERHNYNVPRGLEITPADIVKSGR
jgi:uncharacterized phage-associated protein